MNVFGDVLTVDNLLMGAVGALGTTIIALWKAHTLKDAKHAAVLERWAERYKTLAESQRSDDGA